MTLTRAKKRYLKKSLKKLPLAEIATNLDISEKQILRFLKSHWRAEKYQKFLAQSRTTAGAVRAKRLGDGWLKQNWKVLVFLAFLVFAVYLNSLGNDFVSDDVAEILENENLGSFGYAFSHPPDFIRPPLYYLAYKVGGLNPLFFRLINVAFHLGSVWLAYILISLMATPALALFTTSIFAVHPILVEAVTWISGGGYSQYALFFLLSFIAYLLSQKRGRFYFLSLFAFILAVASTQKAIVLALVFLLYEISFGQLRQSWKKLIPFFGLSVILGLLALGKIGQRSTILETAYYQEPGFHNPLIQIPVAITSYLELIFWPKNLTLYHSEMIFGQTEYFLRLGGFFLFLATIVYFFKKDRRVFFWLTFFLVTLLPSLTPFRIGWIVAERYVYLGALGIFVLTALMIHKIGEVSRNKKISYLFLAVILLALSARTMIRNLDWKNQDSLWLATAKASPSSPQNHNNLGDYYARQGDMEKAVEEFKIAIKLKPNYGDAYHNLANTYQQTGEKELAIENYQKALTFNANLWQSHQNLAGIYFDQEEFELAKQELEKAIEINSQNANLYTNLGVIHLKLGEKEKAKEEFQEALVIDPNDKRANQLLQTLTP